MMDYGYFIKRNETNIVAFVELDQYGSGYSCAPKSLDPWGKYDWSNVQAYAKDHPEMEVVWDGEKYIPKEV